MKTYNIEDRVIITGNCSLKRGFFGILFNIRSKTSHCFNIGTEGVIESEITSNGSYVVRVDNYCMIDDQEPKTLRQFVNHKHIKPS